MPSPHLRLRTRPTAIALAVLSFAATPQMASAQQAEPSARIEITGSIIRRSVNDETALPVTSIKASEMDVPIRNKSR